MKTLAFSAECRLNPNHALSLFASLRLLVSLRSLPTGGAATLDRAADGGEARGDVRRRGRGCARRRVAAGLCEAAVHRWGAVARGGGGGGLPLAGVRRRRAASGARLCEVAARRLHSPGVPRAGRAAVAAANGVACGPTGVNFLSSFFFLSHFLEVCHALLCILYTI